MPEPIRCKKDTCDIQVKHALFNGYYAHCATCKKAAGIATTPDRAIGGWNRWVEIGGFIQVVAPPR